MHSRILVAGLLVAAIAFTLACGSEPEMPGAAPAASVNEQVGELQEARKRVESLAGELAAQRTLVKRADEELGAARSAQKKAEQKLADAKKDAEKTDKALKRAEKKLARLQPKVPDDALFRNVQRELLEAPALSQVAIRAEVHDGKVVLHGSVNEPRLRDAAERLVRNTPGVREVDNQILAGSGS